MTQVTQGGVVAASFCNTKSLIQLIMQYIIIGAVAGGASTAARLRRMDEHASIIFFEKGDYVSYANCGLPYYIGDVITDRNKLFVQTAAAFKNRFAIDVRVRTEVTAIDPVAQTVTATNLFTGEVYTERYDKLVLSPGAEPIRPPLPGINLKGIFTLRNVADTDVIKSYVQHFPKGKAVVIGAGFIGLEMAENLAHLGMEVSVVEMSSQVMAPLDYPMAALVQQHLRSKGIRLILNTAVTGFYEEPFYRLLLSLNNGDALEADVVILSIGVRPDVRLAKATGLQLGAAGGIWVNKYLQTSNPNIYAVGDAIEFDNPITGKSMSSFLAGPANKQGRICANNIVLGNAQAYEGAINTAIVKIFDLTAGVAGMAVKHLKAAGVEHLVSTTYNGSHAGYYPGANMMTIQLAFAPGTGRLLGAQVVGGDGVDKRLDLLASVIKKGGTIYDLTEIEHAYAPPFSSAKDPVNIAGFAAENILLHRVQPWYWDSPEAEPGHSFLLDVRTPTEFASGSIGHAVNVPLDELRSRLTELPKDAPIYLFCQIGMRGYMAARILLQSGFERVYNLSGGYRLWLAATSEKGQLLAQKDLQFAG
ncbi:FAD-dependent oxidoreductase [Pseudocnuella soli]|uniref:FAD-dependent oxidoreductase n=1 Tax=Pseudocnuella soli TaxID=2502779 RepID=UPI00195E42FA|nr:FAD-dependent oxidoreductase [Pseudocnuella soli]